MTQNKTIDSVQALRSIAAIAVVTYHVLKMMVHNGGYAFEVPEYGASGVDLFFVISGFIMVYTSSEAFCKPGAMRSFIRRRFIRIVPTYWFYTSVVVLLLVVAPALFSSTVFNWRVVISSYFFLLSEVRAGEIGTVLQTGWTLCYEVYFYLLFAVLLNFSKKYFLPVTIVVFFVGYLLGQWTALPSWLLVVSNPILFEFVLGCVIALMFNRGLYLSYSWSFIAIILSVFTIVFVEDASLGSWSRVIYWGIPGGLILWSAISLEMKGFKTPKLLVALGGSSYTLYLVHPLFLPFVGKVWAKFSIAPLLSGEVLFVIALVGSVVIGHIMYLLIEKPMTRWAGRAIVST